MHLAASFRTRPLALPSPLTLTIKP
jgi:hypothetical protein